MLLKGLVKVFTLILIVFSLWRLSFTYFSSNEESKYKAIAEKNVSAQNADIKGFEKQELVAKEYNRIADSMRGEQVLNILGAKYTYQEVKQKELKLGLDLQGGMSVTLEVGIDELIKSMSNNSTNPILLKAIDAANVQKANTEADFITLFAEAFQKQNPGASLAQFFTKPTQIEINPSSTNEEVIKVIRKEASSAFDRTYNVIVNRISSTGLEQPNINKNKEKGFITVELAGVRDPESLRQTLQAAAKLQFWEVRTNEELAPILNKAQEVSEKFLKGTASDTGATVLNENVTKTDTAIAQNTNDTQKANDSSKAGSLGDLLASNDSNSNLIDSNEVGESLFKYMMPVVDQGGKYLESSIIGITNKQNAEKVMEILNLPIVKNLFPPNTKFLFGEVPGSNLDKNDPKAALGIYAIKTIPGTDKAKLEGDMVKSAKFDFQQQTGTPEIQLTMNQQGAQIWSDLTGANVGRPIAIALDDYIYSAPNVINRISGGVSSITGNFTSKSGNDLANILEIGKLDAPAKIVQEQIIGSTLGKESIRGGMTSFLISFAIIFILMLLYYNTGGIVANIALTINLLVTFGLLAYFGATLTMPGIAGLVLGIGMAVDVNVLIFERIKEELARGKSYAQAVDEGYKRSYAPVFDGHLTGIITAAILLYFGFGAIKGFATTQLIALFLSLYTGISVSRMITDMYMKRGRHFNYFTKLSRMIFKKSHFKFIEMRKKTYVISSIIILLGLASFINGFDYGVEFSGGRSYTIRFDAEHSTAKVREALRPVFGDKTPIVKTIGAGEQLNIVTDYLIDKSGKDIDSTVTKALYTGLKQGNFLPANVDLATFNSTQYIVKTDKILPTISQDLTRGAIYATVLAIIAIFIYILVRFKKWQYSIGTIISLVHDSLFMLALFSFCRHIVPFSLEIDQHFIAALLTLIGFSMNDTVVVFDRIREYFRLDPKANKFQVINHAINDTLSRTVMTSITVFLTVLVLFIFGGDVLRGFSFAMMLGVIVGIYSSVFVAAPVLVDFDKKDSLRVEEDKEERIRILKQQA